MVGSSPRFGAASAHAWHAHTAVNAVSMQRLTEEGTMERNYASLTWGDNRVTSFHNSKQKPC
eukprot:5964126-Amphidinium_carterae.1